MRQPEVKNKISKNMALKIQKFEIIGIILFVAMSAIIFLFWDNNANQERLVDLSKVMTAEEIAQFEKTYGWTPPYGYTQKQLFNFMNDNLDATPEELEDGAKEAQLKGNIFSTSEIGFLFNYPKDMFVLNGSVDQNDNFRIFVIPNSYKDNKEQDLTAVVISASLNQPPETPLEWLEGPESGADMSKGYSELDVDGQKAISMNGANWVVVDTPDNKY